MTHPLAGRKQSAEHIAKRVAKLRALGVYENNRRRLAQLNRDRTGVPMAEEIKAKIAQANKDKKNALGFKRPEIFRRKLSDYWKQNREKHNHYVDGRGYERNGARQADMGGIEYRLWREKVFARDNWTCIICGTRGDRVHADHIKPYARHPALRYDTSNGRTLCVPCHRATPTYGRSS